MRCRGMALYAGSCRGSTEKSTGAAASRQQGDAADLVVEVVSPESVERDYDDKRREYEQGGVPEYWILNPTTQRADFCRLDAQGRYQPAAPDAHGVYHCGSVPQFWLQVDWLWQDPLPDVDEAVRQITTPAYLDDLAAGLDDAAARALLDRLRRLGKLPEQDS